MLRPPMAFRVTTILILLAILGTGLAFLVLRADRPARRLEVVLPTSAPAAEVVVYVSGAVGVEGVYSLREGDRVVDAIEAAGGLTSDADRSRVNLASRVSDEQHIHVPRAGEVLPDQKATVSSGLIDLNTASQAQLEELPGIGPALASAIIEYRETSGGFERVEDLLNVPRIGEATLARLRPLVSVG